MSPATPCGTLPGPEYSTVVFPHGFGLCDRCLHQRVVQSGRGSVFSLCERSFDDPRYPKYPRVPVGSCPGFTERAGDPPAPAGR
jgi:hypothetical protein